MRVGDELISHGLIKVQEHKGHVLTDVLLDLTDPLRMVFAVFDHAVVGLEAEFNLLEDLLG